jgi:hypothetical protein
MEGTTMQTQSGKLKELYATPETINKMREWAKSWATIEKQMGAEFLESLPDEQFEAVVAESRKPFGIPEDEALAALLAIMPVKGKVFFGRIEDCPQPQPN